MKTLAQAACWVTILATATLACGRAGETPVALIESAEVHQEMIRLADLLPPATPPNLRQVAVQILLGRAPQPGSLRLLSREQVEQRLSESGLPPSSCFLIPAQITVRRGGRALTQEQIRPVIARALAQRAGRSEELLSQQPLTLPSPAPLISETAELKIFQAHWDAARHQLEFLLRCSRRSDCAPFLVVVPLRADPLPTASGLKDQRPVPPPLPFPANRKPVFLARAGQPATLILERRGVRMTLPVVCLERGISGQQIRVRARSGRPIFHAEIVGPGQLHASF